MRNYQMQCLKEFAKALNVSEREAEEIFDAYGVKEYLDVMYPVMAHNMTDPVVAITNLITWRGGGYLFA